MGQLYSGQSTDPNTGPLTVVMALALACTANPERQTATAARPHHETNPGTPGRRTTNNGNAIDDDGSRNDMKKPKAQLALLIALPLLLTGCAAAVASPDAASPATSMSAGMSMAPGQSMGPGMSMPAKTTTSRVVPAESVGAGPSKSAAMICQEETSASVKTLMGLHSPPPTRSTWVDHLYTCTYQVAGGPLVLSVKESTGAATARGYFNALRPRLGHTTAVTGLAGLGLPAYQNTTGRVVFLKDNATLPVDATALPHQVGPQKTSRADLASTVATDILACWAEK